MNEHWYKFLGFPGTTDEELEEILWERRTRGIREDRERKLLELAKKHVKSAEASPNRCICGGEIWGRCEGRENFKVCSGLLMGHEEAAHYHNVALPPDSLGGWECSH